MTSRILIVPAAAISVALMVAALWAWQQSPHLAFDAERPDVVLWSIRSAAIAAGALAQAIIFLFVVGMIYRARPIDALLRVLSVALFSLGLVGAVALGWAGR